ncbi:MAG: hypothetical protein ACKO14_12510 [Armatimonadota bacterium]
MTQRGLTGMLDWITLDNVIGVIDVLWHWRFWACMAPAGALAYIAYLVLGLSTAGLAFIVVFLLAGFILGIAWDWFHSSEESWFFSR